MSIRSMGERAALASVHASDQEKKTVISAVRVAPRVGEGAARLEGAPKSDTGGIGKYVDQVTTWIPTESIGLFLAFAGAFAVFDSLAQELALAGAALVLTAIYSWTNAKKEFQKRKKLPDRKALVSSTGIAAVAFISWWFAFPGSWVTDPRDLGLAAFWPSLFLAIVALLAPLVAKKLGVEPNKS